MEEAGHSRQGKATFVSFLLVRLREIFGVSLVMVISYVFSEKVMHDVFSEMGISYFSSGEIYLGLETSVVVMGASTPSH